MKKLVLFAVCFGITAGAWAQKSQVKTAVNALNDKEYEKARTAIEAAINDESTKNDARTWYIRGTVYLAIQQQPANEGKQFYKEASSSFKKVVAIDPGYEKEDMNNKFFAVAIYNFNDGLATFQNHKYDQAFANFGEVVELYNMDGGKRFAANKNFDTMARQSALYQAYSAFYSNNYDVAAPGLEKAKADPLLANSNIYMMLSEIYTKKNDNQNIVRILSEGRAAYPAEKSLQNAELNYYIRTGKSAELVTKLEDAIKADPSNSDLLFTLGTAYDQMANPKENNKDLPKPANYAELFTKAESAYKNAATVAPDKAEAHYNAGALYFNRAVMINDQMNAITGSSAADIKKFDALKAERNEWFTKALPFLEKTISLYDPKAATLAGEDKNTYINAISSAKMIYASQNNAEKATELKKKLEAVNK